jgi:6-phospho-beta-glucosidase
VDVKDVEIEMTGINHLNWTTKVWVKGTDITESILRKASAAKGMTMKNIPDFGWDSEFLLSLGALPCSYHRYYYMSDQMLEHQLKDVETKGTRAEIVKKIEEDLFELYKDPNLQEKPRQLEERGGAYYSEAAVQLISSIYNNKKDIQTVNVRNNGTISCLPDNVSIEVDCVIDSEGARPVQLTTPLTPKISGLLQVVKAYEELTVEAAVNGDYGAGLQALTLHPLVGTAKTAKMIFDELLSAHQSYLPQFFERTSTGSATTEK